ncbi:MAG: serine hydroxymethyltransferase [Candidatus Berkelbacteria bacterium]|nr:serine hydroxymethyltransferase [Candidatus Berkelbacteria bacterium]
MEDGSDYLSNRRGILVLLRSLKMLNIKVASLIENEFSRQQTTLSLIPSENYVSPAVQTAQASCFTNKYAEGYPGKRYYGGTEFCDELELLCQTQAKIVFKTDYFVNVQPYSGSPANLAAYLGMIEPGDTIMGLNLGAGGHLTHGHKVSLTAKIFNSVQYNVDPETNKINFDDLEKLALEHKPKVIIAGITAYARTVDFESFSKVAKKVGSYLLADISHISGLVATGLHPTPFGFADVVTTTTHKMLRGPRGALIFTKDDEIATKINKVIFPGMQGGPHMHTISAITQALFEANEPGYKSYCQQIIKNAQVMVGVLKERGFNIVTDGTDNHLWLIDLRNKHITGTEAQEKLESYGIVANKNSIPYDPAGPFKPSGIRMGTPAITTRGIKDKDCVGLATYIADILDNKSVSKETINAFIVRFPIPTV